jgi:hypothetical protein
LIFDADQQRIPPEQVAEWRKKAAGRKRPSRPRLGFLKGPIPLSWLTPASCLPGKALAVGLALWFERGRKRYRSVTLTTPILARFGVNRKAAYRALQRLEEAALVTVARRAGKNPVVTILDTPNAEEEEKTL